MAVPVYFPTSSVRGNPWLPVAWMPSLWDCQAPAPISPTSSIWTIDPPDTSWRLQVHAILGKTSFPIKQNWHYNFISGKWEQFQKLKISGRLGDLTIPLHLRFNGVFYLLDLDGNFFRSKYGKSGGATSIASASSRYWEMFQTVLDGHAHTHPSANRFTSIHRFNIHSLHSQSEWS